MVLSGGWIFAEDLQKAAQEAVAGKHFIEARELYIRLSEGEPANVDYLSWIGRLSSWIKEYPSAMTAYDRALALNPQSVDALLGKAYVLMWQQHFQPATALLIQAKQLAPDSADVDLAWARYYHYQGREKMAESYLLRVLTTQPGNPEAKDLKSHIAPFHAVEVRVGYGHDNFSFASPGNMASASVGYIGDLSEVSIQFEGWNRFGQHVNRMGFSFNRHFGKRWLLQGGALWAPEATVLPEQEYTAGFTRSFPRGVVLGADYSYLRFATANVHILSPTLEYYLQKPVWLSVVYYRSLTAFRSSGGIDSSNNSILVQYNQQSTERSVVHLGYARGNESFFDLSVDRLGRFQANTYIAGLDFQLSPKISLGPTYSYQRRFGGGKQSSFGIGLTIRE